MQEYYEMIKRARAVLAATPKNEVSDSTAADYLRKVRRLRARSQHHGGEMFDGAIAEALKTTKKSSWQASRAALLHCARAGLDGYLTQQDQVQRACRAADLLNQPAQWDLWKLLAERALECALAIEKVRAAALPLKGRIDRHTKRQDMRGLPVDWRERVVARMPTYRAAALTAAVTGCRPAELVNGVRMSIEGGMLVAHIEGAKVDVARGKGQEWRRLEWPLNHPSALVRDLAGEVMRKDGALAVTIKSASNFSKSVSNAAAREWPRRNTTVTPYCFRHQAAADMKASGQLDSGEISAALGHLSDATKSTYGHANMSKGRGVAPARVTAARPVKLRTVTKVMGKVKK
ncbi:MAG: integrase [Gemmatimonadales bacterium]|nr:integrase [Gemmatimonadales bacterium]